MPNLTVPLHRRLIQLAALAVATAAFCLTWAGGAQAGTYDVYACQSVGGVAYGNHSFTTQRFDQQPESYGAYSCTGPGETISSWVAAPTISNRGGVNQLFWSPPATTVVDFAMTREFYFYNAPQDWNNQKQYYLLTAMDSSVLEGGGVFYDNIRYPLWIHARWYSGSPPGAGAFGTGAQTVRKSDFPDAPAASRSLYTQVGCIQPPNNNCSANSSSAVVARISSATVTVRDDQAPGVLAQPDRGLLAGGERAGTEPVHFWADDNAGVRRVEVLDYTSGAAQVVASEDYGAGDESDGGKRCNYAYPVPCPINRTPTDSPGQLGNDERLNPPAFSPGQHTIRLRVTDPAGNIALSDPQSFTVRTPPDSPSGTGGVAGQTGAGGRGALNGQGASDRAALTAHSTKRQRVIKARYGLEIEIVGQLVDEAGKPITGAQLQVVARPDIPAVHVDPAGGAVTDENGNFRYTAPVGPSRILQFVYRSHVGDQQHTAVSEVQLIIIPNVSLRSKPKRVRNGRAVTLLGRVQGDPIPPRGVMVTLQGRVPRGRWSTFASVRSLADGRFSRKYRFRATSRTRSYQLRARVAQQAGYRFAPGASRPVRVRVSR